MAQKDYRKSRTFAPAFFRLQLGVRHKSPVGIGIEPDFAGSGAFDKEPKNHNHPLSGWFALAL